MVPVPPTASGPSPSHTDSITNSGLGRSSFPCHGTVNYLRPTMTSMIFCRKKVVRELGSFWRMPWRAEGERVWQLPLAGYPGPWGNPMWTPVPLTKRHWMSSGICVNLYLWEPYSAWSDLVSRMDAERKLDFRVSSCPPQMSQKAKSENTSLKSCHTTQAAPSIRAPGRCVPHAQTPTPPTYNMHSPSHTGHRAIAYTRQPYSCIRLLYQLRTLTMGFPSPWGSLTTLERHSLAPTIYPPKHWSTRSRPQVGSVTKTPGMPCSRDCFCELTQVPCPPTLPFNGEVGQASHRGHRSSSTPSSRRCCPPRAGSAPWYVWLSAHSTAGRCC